MPNKTPKANNNNQYDYIFAGGGMAALSLAYYLNNSILRSKKILILDQEYKGSNDHTWCFWEKENNAFDQIVYRNWTGFWFHGTRHFSEFLKLENYNYKMIRSIDFYEFVIPQLNKNPNIEFKKEKVVAINKVEGNSTVVKTIENEFIAHEFVFDSIYKPEFNKPQNNNLLQHFLGWVIETEKPIFEPEKPTLFDFRIDQNDECRFVYTLPFSTNRALVEFTVFSDKLLEKTDYEQELRKYLIEKLGISNESDYQIIETEFGIIPMSDEPVNIIPQKGIIKIGTAGGFVKASTGYSFQRTQKYLQSLVKSLENNQLPQTSDFNNKWKSFLDSVLLNVMVHKRASQADIFTSLFRKNKPKEVLRFLSEESTIWQDLKLMNTVPKITFIKSAFYEILRKLNGIHR